MHGTDRRLQRWIEGARNYAAANRSDPFAFRRAMTHVLNGICDVGQDGSDRCYEAEPYQETRALPDGRTYHVTAYRNVKRI